MSSTVLLQALQREARVRQFINLGLLALPALAVAVAVAYRCRGGFWLLPILTLLALAYWLQSKTRAIDARWMARRLDQQRRDLDDSAELLFADPETLPPLARLQRERLQARLQAAPRPDLRPPWPLRSWAWSTAGGAILVLGLLWPPRPSGDATAPRPATNAASATVRTRITAIRIDIAPPAYTGLPARSETALQLRVAEGSSLRWRLRFAPQPAAAELLFHDGSRLPLQRQGEDWLANRRMHRAALYRLQLSGALPLADSRLQRIDVLADRPPQIRVIAPERSLSLLEDGQASWNLAFEASDDHGLGAAELRITLAQGSGENIRVSERRLPLRGEGDARHRRYRQALDLASFGFAAGDDLIVRFAVSDLRTPQPQTARSASYILRWPPPGSAESTGLEGMMKKVLPAYFRSQRQIIIDSEALLKQRGKLARNVYVERSDLIGVDQRILRLRYGQFLGEEVEDGPALPEGHSEDDGHGHGGSGMGAATGEATSVREAYGHTHDEAEAATLLDPETRALLKQALDQMWQAELHLRQGHPDRALPFEYRALGFIKQVQQASRIYLARVGLELPPIDEARRLGGKREGIASRADLLSAVPVEASPAQRLWLLLDTPTLPLAADALDEFEAWLREREASLPDALGLYAAMDELRQAPECLPCAARLRARLWPLLARPATALPRPRGEDAAARAYLDALRTESRP